MRRQFPFSVLAVPLALALAGCATPMTSETRATLNRVVVVNEFPDAPKYTHVGTTIFNNILGNTDDVDFKDVVAEEVAGHLRKSGYDPEVVEKHPGNRPGVLVVRIVPRDIDSLAYTDGYGYYRRTFLAVLAKQYTYVALNLVPELNGKSRCAACYAMSTTRLSNDEMPPSWGELSEEMKEAFRESLRADIRKAIDEAYRKAKL